MAKITRLPETLLQSTQEGIVVQQKVLSPGVFFPRTTDVLPDQLFHYSLEKRLELIESILALPRR